MAEDNPNRHDLQPEDAQRLIRLSEEVRGRLTEMALIIARVSGSEYSGGVVRKYVPREGTQVQQGAPKSASFEPHPSVQADWLEIVEIFPGFECCYGSIGGQTILECPCGAR